MDQILFENTEINAGASLSGEARKQYRPADKDEQNDSLAKLRNVAYATFEGLANTAPEIVDAFEAAKQDLGATAASLAPALAVGAAVGALTKYGGAARIAGGGLMAAVGVAGLSMEADRTYESLRKAWNATDNSEVDAAGKELSEQFGKFAFNSLLFAPVSTAGSAAGFSIRNRALQAELNAGGHVGWKTFGLSYQPGGSRLNPIEPGTGRLRDDNCVACVSALLRTKFGRKGINTTYETAHDVEKMFGSTSAANSLNWKRAKNYVQEATGAKIESSPTRFGGRSTEPGHYVVLLKDNVSQEQHLIYGRALNDGKVLLFDPQSGLRYNYKDVASGRHVNAFKFEPPTPDLIPTKRPPTLKQKFQLPQPISKTMVTVEGTVVQLKKSSVGQFGAHQRFDINLTDGSVLRVKNNLSAGTEVPIHVGSALTIRGELLELKTGKVLHWTHKNKYHRNHEDGWIMLDGKKYA